MLFGEPERKRIGKREREALYAEQKGRCNYCGVKLDMAYFPVDHKTPVARNGTNDFSNLQLICSPCNTRKGDMTDGEFRRKYKLTPARQANGPPAQVIPQGHFEDRTKEVAKRRKKASDDSFWRF